MRTITSSKSGATSPAAAPEQAKDKIPAKKTTRKPKAESASAKAPIAEAQPKTKAEMVLAKLRAAEGATLSELMEATGWQAHSVRGFLSGTCKKRLGLNVLSELIDGTRHYRIGE